MSKVFPYAYIQKKFTKTSDAKISIMAKAIQYGLGVFGGIRGHWNEEQKDIHLFRLEDHFVRLAEAAKILGMNLPLKYKDFKKLALDLIKKNKAKEDVYLRPTLYAGSTALTPRFDNPDDDLALYMISLKDYFSSTKGLNVCISSWRRYDDSMISTKAKCTGSYANSALAKTEALRNGFDEAIFLNQDGNVCEASGANIFGIKAFGAGPSVAYTPPLSDNVLHGITRRSIITLLEDELGMEVREESFDRSTLYTFDELFFTGTAAKVSWIAQVDKRQIGNGKQGRTTKKLQELMELIAHGDMPKYQDWLTPVYS